MMQVWPSVKSNFDLQQFGFFYYYFLMKAFSYVYKKNRN